MNAEQRARKRRLDRVAYLVRRVRELWDCGGRPKARRLQRRLLGNALYRLQEEHLNLLRAGVSERDPRRRDVERRLRLAVYGPPPASLSDEAKARAIEWFGERKDGER